MGFVKKGGGGGPVGYWAMRDDLGVPIQEQKFYPDSTGYIGPPDPDAWDSGDIEGGVQFIDVYPPGGTDGFFHYFWVLRADGHYEVDKFSGDLLTLLESWVIPGWSSWGYVDGVTPYERQEWTGRHCCASSKYVVVFTMQENPSTNEYTYMQFVVFDLAGNVVANHSIVPYVDPGPFGGGPDAIWGSSDSYILGDEMFFAYYEYTSSDVWVAKINLLTGEITKLINPNALDIYLWTLDPATWTFFNPTSANEGRFGGPYSILPLDNGDIFVAGFAAAGVITPDGANDGGGTPVWYKGQDDLPHSPPFGGNNLAGSYNGACDSPGGGVFVAITGDAVVLEYDLSDGTLLQSVPVIEEVGPIWGPGRSAQPHWLRQRQRDDIVRVKRGPNAPISTQVNRQRKSYPSNHYT